MSQSKDYIYYLVGIMKLLKLTSLTQVARLQGGTAHLLEREGQWSWRCSFCSVGSTE
ncbi:hypothetical protein BDV06DRAFT_196953 [Aspergillus oleicola]